MTPDEYCQQKAAGSGSSFYYSFLFLDPGRRQAITALYAFCREVDDIVDEATQPELARIKLQWWREDIARAYTSDIPQHPVNQALQAVCQHYRLPLEYFHDIIDGMEMDLDQVRYASFRDLALYCHRVAGVVGLLSAEIFGHTNRDTLKYANELGIAFQLTNILRDVREDAYRGRIYIPLDELERFGLSTDHILHSRETTPELKSLFEYQADRAADHYRNAFRLLPDIDRYNQLSGLVMADIYMAILDEIRHDEFRLMEHGIRLTPLRKFWIAWRCVRRERRRHKRRGI